jgi:hypothetical protein
MNHIGRTPTDQERETQEQHDERYPRDLAALLTRFGLRQTRVFPCVRRLIIERHHCLCDTPRPPMGHPTWENSVFLHVRRSRAYVFLLQPYPPRRDDDERHGQFVVPPRCVRWEIGPAPYGFGTSASILVSAGAIDMLQRRVGVTDAR